MPLERNSWWRRTVSRRRLGSAGTTAPLAISVVVPLPVIRFMKFCSDKQGAAHDQSLSFHTCSSLRCGTTCAIALPENS